MSLIEEFTADSPPFKAAGHWLGSFGRWTQQTSQTKGNMQTTDQTAPHRELLERLRVHCEPNSPDAGLLGDLIHSLVPPCQLSPTGVNGIYETTAGKILRMMDPCYDIAHAGHETTEPDQVKQLADLLREAFPETPQPDLPYGRRTAQDTERDNLIVQIARDNHERDGVLEIDSPTVISEGDDNGAYVQAWVWVGFDGTELDKEGEEHAGAQEDARREEQRPELEPVAMPSRTTLACGCEMHGRLEQCPIHDTKASPFNVHPEGRPL